MLTRRMLLGGVLVSVLSGRSAAAQADIYVSTSGKEQWSGRLPEPRQDGTDGPVASIEQAKRRVAELRLREPGRERPIIVSIRGGTYYLSEPLTFGPEDSGTENSPTIFEAFSNETPVLSGGVRITGWQITDEGHWRTTLDEVRSGQWSFAQLFVDDQRRYRPRLPERGYYQIAEQLGRGQFGFADGDIRTDWADLKDVEVVAFHVWSAPRMRIRSVVAAEHRVVFTNQSWRAFDKGNRYLVDNVRDALRQPGQWYLDRSLGQLTYIPKAGEQPDKAVVIAPRLEQLVAFRGDLPGKRWVTNLQFRGLTFAHSNWTLPSTGQDFPQAEIGLRAAIEAFGARDIAFERCAIRHVGACGIAFGAGSRNNRLESCELIDLGGGGVKIGHAGSGTWDSIRQPANDPEMHVSHHVIRNCLVAHGGRLHPAANGIWIGQSSYNTVEHNDVFDFYQIGISVGWTWGYTRSDAHHNDIAFNHVYRIGQGVTSDMGAIYTLGVQPGTVVRNNHIHDVRSFLDAGWGLYTDEGSSEIVMENNLVHHTKSAGFHQHFGRENRIRNNIFAYAGEFPLEVTKSEPHISFYFERNIVYWSNSKPLIGGCPAASPPCNVNIKFDRNIYWNTVAKRPVFPGSFLLNLWREGTQDEQALFADPLFVDAEKSDFRLKANSPALQTGFQPFDATQAGRQEPALLSANLPGVPPGFS
ncbi:right-handed parallel beta-helix repeat-containing protein [Bradyrhizobium tropiciagri]|uniref:right-handed parallel beta-helix repeat-containing protein n=1 Tax=Bradyrhizobium tropiciagri TaxID=312253 RepID=UPI001BACCF1E|nr:right-handed parallel beta-helix repeat-containing protein [Bradyrhizobium tropiciagri]MBR0874907.1 right-handed parallel beta-helix repeat-containing protein [Bradyrhizobium tropiciagri]